MEIDFNSYWWLYLIIGMAIFLWTGYCIDRAFPGDHNKSKRRYISSAMTWTVIAVLVLGKVLSISF